MAAESTTLSAPLRTDCKSAHQGSRLRHISNTTDLRPQLVVASGSGRCRNDGRNAVPPTGDDWNDLFGAVKECVGELGSSLAQQGPTPETAGFPMPDDRYVACKGDSCPFCGASGPIGQSWNTENGVASQKMSCNECDREWVDIYNLGGYQAV